MPASVIESARSYRSFQLYVLGSRISPQSLRFRDDGCGVPPNWRIGRLAPERCLMSNQSGLCDLQTMLHDFLKNFPGINGSKSLNGVG